MLLHRCSSQTGRLSQHRRLLVELRRGMMRRPMASDRALNKILRDRAATPSATASGADTRYSVHGRSGPTILRLSLMRSHIVTGEAAKVHRGSVDRDRDQRSFASV
ncbi:hypothetical protein PHSY_001058 [Pseudozyma hubeiensis SY62]|uniref:Uncharacterized protein n=1 Tax=Pseudozyma hubeiensis (strain SY62) TaxID=1305764 RepID=R9NXN7_PSEHS|nr:hypothetical protein PHSY_001058 [Pseudozyma hubeiensis SY62]GAC93493.1 hypothetical protein PHSY_001058 [Pseudozyma hubeiensis SY62]